MATITPYLEFLKGRLTGAFDLTAVTLKLMLLDATHTPNLDSHDFVNDVSGDEVSGTGYSAGGFALSGALTQADTSGDRYLFKLNNVSAAGCTFDWRYAVIYRDTGTPSTSNLVALIDPGALQSLSAATLAIAWHADGVFEMLGA